MPSSSDLMGHRPRMKGASALWQAFTRLSLLALLCCNGATGTAGQGKTLWQPPALSPGVVNSSQMFLHGTFPAGFLWGVGSSAFQTEGAWNQDGKGPSVWDYFTHSPSWNPRETADVSSDSYIRWQEDLLLLKTLGVHFYTFSLSWARIFPNGIASGPPNAAGVAHYSRLIDRLREEGIEPVVTLYHWDLPQALHERYNGWLNESLVDVFDDYATFCFRTFGGQVRYWITMHNPYLVAWQGYITGLHAPGEKHSLAAAFTVAHNLIKAHAKAWHTYDSRFRAHQQGQVSIALGTHWMEPLGGSEWQVGADRCQDSMQAVLGWFAEPIHGGGDYPTSLRHRHTALIPEFTEDERRLIRGSADFFALSFGPDNLRLGHSLTQFGQRVSLNLRRVLSWVKLEYDGPRVFIVENGWFSNATVGKEDTVAIYLMKKFVNQVLQAVVHDGVRVFAYAAWSLVDGFEWNFAYRVRRGLYYVDFSDPNRTRTAKTSAYFYHQMISDNGFPGGDETQVTSGQFPCGFQWGVSDSTLQVHFNPFSPQFTDPRLYRWNLTGDGALKPVQGVQLRTRGAQCTDFLFIQKHVQLVESAGVTHYRFALNWSLILPRGNLSIINKEALRYYRCVVKELWKRNIQVAVTLYYPTHSLPLLGLPAPIHKAGGWLNRSTVDAFREYATLCFEELGAWVTLWVTINEPNRLSQAYNASDPYLAAHHLILAHAEAWHIYNRDFRHKHGAWVSLAVHADWAEPANPFVGAHSTATSRFLLFELALFLDPLLAPVGGGASDYPRELREHLLEREHLGVSRRTLPRFTDAERARVRGALDAIGINHFTTRLVSQRGTDIGHRQAPDHDCQLLLDPTWPSSPMGQAVVPWGLRRVLNWFKERYGDRPILITASGVDDKAVKDDQLRKYYLKSYLQEALKAYQTDGVNIKGFYAWRLQDHHSSQFGLFSSDQHRSIPKSSVTAYREIIALRGFPAGGRGEPCHPPGVRTTCVLCGRILENKALLFFGVCLFLTFGMLSLVIVTIVRKKRTPPRSVPARHKIRQWDRFALRHMVNNYLKQ